LFVWLVGWLACLVGLVWFGWLVGLVWFGLIGLGWLVGGLVPGSSRGSDWLMLLFFYGVASPFGSFSPFSDSSIRVPVLSPMVGCKHPHH